MSQRFISIEQAEQDTLSAAAYLAETIESGDGRAEAMNVIVPIYLAKGEVDLAAELANSVDDPFTRDRLLTHVAAKCAEIDDDEYALQLADAIDDTGIRLRALERIGVAKASKSDYEAATNIAAMMEHPDAVYSAIAVDQATRGDRAAANEALGHIDFAFARVSAQQLIAAGKIESGAGDDAVTFLDDAAQGAAEIGHDEEKIRALCDIGTLFIEAKRNDRAIETFGTARDLAEGLENIHRDMFLGSCALGFLFAGSMDLADRALDGVTDKSHMSSALVGFAREYWKNDEKEDALETLEEAYAIVRSQRETETRDSKARNGLMAAIATQFAGFGKTERGIEIALENLDPNESMGALAQIARILIVQNEPELARETVNEIDDDAYRVLALVGISDEMASLGKNVEAGEVLVEAASLADAIPQLASRANALNEIAVRHANAGDLVKAGEMLRSSLSVITQIIDESSQAAALATLSRLYDNLHVVRSEADAEQIKRLLQEAELAG